MQKNKYLLSVMFLTSLVVLSSCNEGTTRSSPSQWGYCDPSIYKGLEQANVDDLGSKLQCAMMKAPLDYSNPSKGTIDIALSRFSYGDTTQRKGAILINPGGPGADGLSFAYFYVNYFDQANNIDQVGAKFKQFTRQYDFIGFSPRGTGSSTNLLCGLKDKFYYPVKFVTDDLSEENLGNIFANSALFDFSCQQNELTRYINTDATARDMDLIRNFLGDQKLSYIGYSYGTWLGVWYASLFPERVNKMLLDSSVDVNLSLPVSVADSQALGLQYILDKIIAPYAALNNNIFNLGTSVEDIRSIPGTLNINLKSALSPKLGELLFRQNHAKSSVEIIAAAKAINQVLTENPSLTVLQAESKLDNYSYSNDAEENILIKKAARGLLSDYFKAEESLLVPVQENYVNSVRKAVACNDTQSPTDAIYWTNAVRKLVPLSPLFAIAPLEISCTDAWGGPTVSKPAVANANYASPILMVQNEFDGATPSEGALKTQEYLDNASMIYVKNSYSHGVFPSNIGCVDSAILDYFVNDIVPAKRVTCEGENLATSQIPRNISGSNARFLSTAIAGDNPSMENSFSDKQQAQKNRDDIHDYIINAEIGKH